MLLLYLLWTINQIQFSFYESSLLTVSTFSFNSRLSARKIIFDIDQLSVIDQLLVITNTNILVFVF